MADDVAPLNVSEGQTRREAIQEAFENEIHANDHSDFIIPVTALLLYALPAVAAAFELHTIGGSQLQWAFSGLALVSIVGGLILYRSTSGTPGRNDAPNDAVYPDSQSETAWPWTFPPRKDLTDNEEFTELDSDEIEILLSEYEQIAEEVRYRDGLLNRTTYFGIAILGVLATATDTVGLSIKPMIVLISSLSIYIFAMALTKYKDARDLHWKRKRDMERLIPEFHGKLTAYHANRTADRRFLDKFSLSSFMINTYLMLLVISVGGYTVFTVALPWLAA